MENLDLLKEITAAAERFVNKAPRQIRMETERQALLDAITRAQLLLSVSGHNDAARPRGAQKVADQRTLYGPALRTVQGGKAKYPHKSTSRAEKTANRNAKRR